MAYDLNHAVNSAISENGQRGLQSPRLTPEDLSYLHDPNSYLTQGYDYDEPISPPSSYIQALTLNRIADREGELGTSSRFHNIEKPNYMPALSTAGTGLLGAGISYKATGNKYLSALSGLAGLAGAGHLAYKSRSQATETNQSNSKAREMFQNIRESDTPLATSRQYVADYLMSKNQFR